MNSTVLPRELVIPSPRQFGDAFSAFFLTVSAIATYRANEGGPERFGELSVLAADLLVEAADTDDLLSVVEDMAEDEHEKVIIGILYEELMFVSWRYRGAFELAGMDMPEVVAAMPAPPQFSDEHGDPGESEVIDTIGTVKGSIQTLLDKLSSWMRKAVEAIMEVLKLTRGLVH